MIGGFRSNRHVTLARVMADEGLQMWCLTQLIRIGERAAQLGERERHEHPQITWSALFALRRWSPESPTPAGLEDIWYPLMSFLDYTQDVLLGRVTEDAQEPRSQELE